MLGNLFEILKDRKTAIAHFHSVGSENPILETKISFELLQHSNEKTPEEIMDCLSQKKPIQYLAGYTYVDNKKIIINKHVLLPGPEMDLLIGVCAKYIKPKIKVLDLCTGSGVISVILSQKFKHAQFYATDISKKALCVAKKNVELYNLKNIYCLQGDLFSPVIKENQTDFDLIISNPPYCKTEDINLLPRQIKEHVPHIAINGGIDGLGFHRKIIQESPKYLKKGGYLILENEQGQSRNVQRLLIKNRFLVVEVIKNHMAQDRLVVARLNHG